MSLISRFFGKLDDDDPPKGKTLVANAAIEEPLSLQVLFPKKVSLDAKKLAAAVERYDRSIGNAKCEIDPSLGEQGNLLGLLGWDKHVIKLVGFDAPMPREVVELCVAPAHYPAPLKKKAQSAFRKIIEQTGQALSSDAAMVEEAFSIPEPERSEDGRYQTALGNRSNPALSLLKYSVLARSHHGD